MLPANRLLSLSISGLLLAGTAMAAGADSMTVGPSTVTSATDFSGAFFLPKFNSSLGTLDSVFITLDNSLTTTLTVTNNSGSASTGSARTELQAALADSSTTFSAPGNILTPSGGLFSVIDDFSTNAVGYSLTGSGSTILSPPTKNSTLSSAPGFTGSSVLAYFTGTGNAELQYLTFTSTNLNNTGGNTAATQSSSDTLTATVTYNYTPTVTATPEPGTWALMVAGASTGLAALRRRRNKK